MDLNLFFVRIRNWADLDEFDPVILPLPIPEAIRQIEQAVPHLSGWHVESSDVAQGTMHLTRSTRVFRFVDDIHLKLEAVAGGTRIRGRSQSRVGLSDLGQNKRNLRELLRRLPVRPTR